MIKWLQAFWWARGIVAAISLAAFLPDVVDLSRFEILRAFHSVLWAWNDLMAEFGEYLGTIFSIPAIPAFWVNTCVYFSCFVVPLAYGIVRDGIVSSELGIGGIARLLAEIVVALCLPILPIYVKGFSVGILILIAPYMLCWGVIALLAISKLPGFGRGIVTFVGFVLCLEVLYWLQTPVVTEAINSFSCSHVELPSPGCPDTVSN